MNDEASKLLRELAEKLGTTTEYLWHVLIQQAPIHAYTNLFFVLLIFIYVVALFKLHQRFMNDDNEYSYYNQEEALIMPMVLASIVGGLAVLDSLVLLRSAVTALLNPEYWALKHVLDSL